MPNTLQERLEERRQNARASAEEVIARDVVNVTVNPSNYEAGERLDRHERQTVEQRALTSYQPANSLTAGGALTPPPWLISELATVATQLGGASTPPKRTPGASEGAQPVNGSWFSSNVTLARGGGVGGMLMVLVLAVFSFVFVVVTGLLLDAREARKRGGV